MTDKHPITPSPELVQLVMVDAPDCPGHQARFIANYFARWGADQELKACCEWVDDEILGHQWGDELRAYRRPKPPSLKKQALAILSQPEWSADEEETIRQALETLPDDAE